MIWWLEQITLRKKKGTGLSKASMQAMISADSSMKQAKVQGSMATQIEGTCQCA